MNVTDPSFPTRDYSAEPESRTSELISGTDRYIRENPVPAILGALAVGFAIGLLTRYIDHPAESHPVRDYVDDTSSSLGSFFRPVAKKTRRAYHQSSEAVRDAMENASDRVRDIDVDHYVDPVAKWWRRLWS